MDISPEILANSKIAFAALCGGITRLLFKPASSVRKTLWLLFGCVTCGYYGTPVFCHWLSITPDYAGAVGALLGLVGLSFAQAAFSFAEEIDMLALYLKIKGLLP